jgi:hypothetical protein
MVGTAWDAILPQNYLLNPSEMACMMDIHGSVLNPKGMHLLCLIKTIAGEHAATSHSKSYGWATSICKIKDTMYHSEEKTLGIILLKTTDKSDFDGVVFDYRNMVIFLLQVNKLDAVA